MIPDKIYLGVGPMSGDEPNKRYIYAEWNENPMPRVQNIAYIRKSALLEWAEAYKEEADSTCRNRTDNSSYGQSVAMRDLINKLESL